MKAVIMAGGYATRLWPITKTRPKPLLPLGKEKIIDHIYKKIKKFDLDVVISTNKRFENTFRDWALGKNVKMIVEETYKEEEKLGAVRALFEVSKKINDDVLVIAGDNVFSFDIDPLLDLYNEVNSPVIALYDVGDTELAKRYGTVEINGQKIKSFHEKPEKPKSTLVGIGIYAFPKNIGSLLEEYIKTNSKHDNLGDFISWLCKKVSVFGYIFDGIWYDVGSPDSYIEAFRSFSSHSVSEDVKIDRVSKIVEPVIIESDVVIKGRSIIGPYTYIGSGSLIENSDVSDSIIFNSVVLRRARIWRSIIDEDCEIRNLELSSSIVGGHAKIQRGD